MRTLYHLLGNNLVANITNFTVWFALTFWVYIETQSVFATGMVAGIYLAFTAGLGFWLGSLVDHHAKKLTMLGSSLVSVVFYALALSLLVIFPQAVFADPYDYRLWLFVLLVMLGVIAGNIRAIALPTLVTLLVPEDRRDRANGLVGMVTGIGFLTTSVISGFLVAWGGMWATLILAIGFSLVAGAHLLFVRVDEPRPAPAEAESFLPKSMDIRGTIRVIAAVPGLFALIFFATFNNFLGGVFMALLDAYGLSLVSVEMW
ncbi:MAG: MFS transporter, partial [Asticcacaulis sp.]